MEAFRSTRRGIRSDNIRSQIMIRQSGFTFGSASFTARMILNVKRSIPYVSLHGYTQLWKCMGFCLMIFRFVRVLLRFCALPPLRRKGFLRFISTHLLDPLEPLFFVEVQLGFDGFAHRGCSTKRACRTRCDTSQNQVRIASLLPFENERATVHGFTPQDPFLDGHRTIDFQIACIHPKNGPRKGRCLRGSSFPSSPPRFSREGFPLEESRGDRIFPREARSVR